MPISSDRFEDISSGDSKGPSPGTNAAIVLAFLRDHSDQAFTQSEIAAETDVKTGSVGPTLVRLRERGRVDHRGTYWRISDHDQSVEAATGHASNALAQRESDDEIPSYEDWQEYAVDPRTSDDE
ncbi:MAG: MarR family transcriptional regulator [Haloarculaceae archaeon]